MDSFDTNSTFYQIGSNTLPVWTIPNEYTNYDDFFIYNIFQTLQGLRKI